MVIQSELLLMLDVRIINALSTFGLCTVFGCSPPATPGVFPGEF